jgi:hypothetical protein
VTGTTTPPRAGLRTIFTADPAEIHHGTAVARKRMKVGRYTFVLSPAAAGLSLFAV